MEEIKPIFIDFHTFRSFKCTWSIPSIPYLPYNNGLFTFSAIKMAVHYTYSYSALVMLNEYPDPDLLCKNRAPDI